MAPRLDKDVRKIARIEAEAGSAGAYEPPPAVDAARSGRPMALTPELVALTLRPEPDLGPAPGWTEMSQDELQALATTVHDECGDKPFWVFAYGSLIWNPTFEPADHRRATAFGWHRSFCIKMDRWRATPDQPGLMMGLERGGRCDGVLFRLPEQDRVSEISRLLHRETRYREHVRMARWVPVRTDSGPERALTFWAGPTGDHYAKRWPLEKVAAMLARACGHVGSCAEYLFNTVSHLRRYGVHDRNLWRLQELVAAEIVALHGRDALRPREEQPAAREPV